MGVTWDLLVYHVCGAILLAKSIASWGLSFLFGGFLIQVRRFAQALEDQVESGRGAWGRLMAGDLIHEDRPHDPTCEHRRYHFDGLAADDVGACGGE